MFDQMASGLGEFFRLSPSGFSGSVDGRADRRRAVDFQSMQDDAAANPDHGRGADGAQKCKEHWHPMHEGASKPPPHTGQD